jgi:hypothetical protein
MALRDIEAAERRIIKKPGMKKEKSTGA